MCSPNFLTMFSISTKSCLISISFFPINTMSSAYANTLWDTVGLLAVNNHSKTHTMLFIIVLKSYSAPGACSPWRLSWCCNWFCWSAVVLGWWAAGVMLNPNI
jgi:hypothetical protein